MIFFDTETCGYHGPIVLIQFAKDDGEVYLYNVWEHQVRKTLELIEEIFCKNTVCGFNLSFDWFHICQLYTTLRLLDPSKVLREQLHDYAIKEADARFGPCVKPPNAIDLMLIARKTKYQSTMARKNVIIKRIPTKIAWVVCEELNKRIQLSDLYFARKSDPTKRWQVDDTKDKDFKNITLRFAPSSKLKALIAHISNKQTIYYEDVKLPKHLQPNELGYAPFATALGQPGNWNHTWPTVIDAHINLWTTNSLARQYAKDDVIYTRQLYQHLDNPEPDIDSTLACLVGAVRWHGYSIDLEAIKNLRQNAVNKIKNEFNSANRCKEYLIEVMSPMQQAVLTRKGKVTTGKEVLEDIAKWEDHPAAKRAQEILDARRAKKEIELYDKLLLAKRFHASFNVIGTLSGRMSGSDDLNPQGIKRAKKVRKAFPLKDEEFILTGGDFVGFEVVLMDAVYQDPVLHKELTSIIDCICLKDGQPKEDCDDCLGKGKTRAKIHAIFGTYLFPDKDYYEILRSKGQPGNDDLYTRSKNSLFSMGYGGTEYTLVTKYGIDQIVASKAFRKWCDDHPTWAAERQKYFDMFCSMRQPDGIGTRVIWKEPAEYIESPVGFRRYYSLENMICKTLFDLANKPPDHWSKFTFKVVRREREQTACGAAQTALYAAAFAIQAANMRSAGNHVIQSFGASLNKYLQSEIWSLQPVGIHEWLVLPMNIHDELMCPAKKDIVKDIRKIIEDFIIKWKKRVPLLEIDWFDNLDSWADK